MMDIGGENVCSTVVGVWKIVTLRVAFEREDVVRKIAEAT